MLWGRKLPEGDDMRAISLSQSGYGAGARLMAEMFRLRRRVFKDRLDWTVSVSGEMEVDTFDALGPDYLMVLDDDGHVVGCVRMLPTLGPTMLSDTFPVLLAGGEMPRSPGLAESSRFCVDTQRSQDLGDGGLRRATFCLFAAMIEWGLDHSPEGIVTVTDARMERVLRRGSWPLTRLGAPCQIGETLALAGFLEVSREALARITEEGGLPPTVLADRCEPRMAA